MQRASSRAVRAGRLAALSLCLVLASLAVTSPILAGPFYTGLVATPDYQGDDASTEFDRAAASGARFMRIFVFWDTIAPEKPAAGSDPRDPGNPVYRWETVDALLEPTVARGLVPILDITNAPRWAWKKQTGGGPGTGAIQPSVTDLADFTAAAVKRYNGRAAGHPRVRYWQLWNEPNLSTNLRPQFEGDRLVSPVWYRKMTNAFYDTVHSVASGNTVIAGGTAPFTVNIKQYISAGPMRFMRDLLCMSADPVPKPTCKSVTKFDVWAHHPYTSGGPTHKAVSLDDVSLGDLPRMKALLDAAHKAGHISTKQRLKFWVTELSWDSSPPDSQGVPLTLHARWVSEALYRMWQSGVELATWFEIRDQPNRTPYFCQCGLWLRGNGGPASDKPKPALQAFRFPFVAFSQPNATVTFWGRTPASNAKTLVIERSELGGWKAMATVRSNRYGIFQGTYSSAAKTGFVRARIVGGGAGDTARPFGLRVPPDRPGCAFGSC